MEVTKYNPFVANPKTKTKRKTENKTEKKLEAKGLALENKKKLDIIYAKGLVKTSKK